ncbi:MAG: Rrf2 family transcriptional regulator [Clostridiales bacterium]|nr:Rrf2 family transcriptional regulator [Clostridiales bacterium]
MRLSTRGKYGLYAMHYLAQHEHEGPQSLSRIASVGIPKQYLEQLLGSLRRNGLIHSVRGANGGYQIAKPSEEITVLDILDAMEGPLALSDCIADDRCCAKATKCRVRHTWERLTVNINRELASVSLKDML